MKFFLSKLYLNLWLLPACVVPMEAFSGALEDAHSGLAQAYNRYYSEVRKNPRLTAAENEEIQDRILAPKQLDVANALHQETVSAYQSMGVTRKRASREGARENGSSRSNDRSLAKSAARSSDLPTDVPAAEEASTGLDAGAFPAEISFDAPLKAGNRKK